LTDKVKAHLALLGTNIFFAINYTSVKYLINHGLVKPFGLNLIRVGVSAVLLWIMFFFKPVKSVIHKKNYGRFFWYALSGIAVNQLLFLKGLSLTYSIHASLLMLTTPVLITFIAVWFLKERLNNYKIAAAVLIFLGVYLSNKNNNNG